jgi:antirestriction protein ArdC
VRKGEKSIPVVFYKPLTKDIENASGEQEKKTIPMMRVFNDF